MGFYCMSTHASMAYEQIMPTCAHFLPGFQLYGFSGSFSQSDVLALDMCLIFSSAFVLRLVSAVTFSILSTASTAPSVSEAVAMVFPSNKSVAIAKLSSAVRSFIVSEIPFRLWWNITSHVAQAQMMEGDR